MKKLTLQNSCFMLFVFILLFNTNLFAQTTQEQRNRIHNEAYFEHLRNGGKTDQFNSSKQTQSYQERNYEYNNSGQIQRKQSYVKGTFVGSNGSIGSYKNGYVMNSYGQTVGYLNQGYFMNNKQQCVGYVKGSQIFSCNGSLLATVYSNGVYNAQGNLIYSIKGETLYSNNYFLVQIPGIDMYSLAAFLLFN